MTASSEYAVETHSLRKVFGAQVAVRDLSLRVPRGEIFGFLGPNGAGKSTSIKMLLGLVRPTSGEALVLGAPVNDVVTRRAIGFLPEDFRFYDWLTASELLRFHGRLCGMSVPWIGTKVPAVLELVGLARHADRRVRGFSKGMLQRLGLAQAIVHEPDLIFLDEPTSGLDPMGRRTVRDILRGERDRGATVFLNSHLLSEIEVTCDLLAVVMTILTSIDTLAGEIASGTIHAIATKPVERWEILAGKFLGFTGMIAAFVAITFAGTVAVAFATTGVFPEHPMRGLLLIGFECELMLAVTFALGTWFSTLTVGVLALGMQGLAFMGGWLEQVSGFSQSVHIVTLGVVSSVLVPSESLWRRAAFEMQTPLAGSLSFSPFANVSIPSWTAVAYALAYLCAALAVAAWHFNRRDL